MVRGVMNEFAIANVHPGVGNLRRAGAEEEQVARLQVRTFYRDHAAPVSLQAGVTRHFDATLTLQHLRETGAVKAEAGDASPGVGNAEKAARQIDVLRNGERNGIRASYISALHPTSVAVDQPDMNPTPGFAGLVRR